MPGGLFQCLEPGRHHKPGFSRKGRLWINASVRLDGRVELAKTLALPGDPIDDIDLIAASYLRWGADCPNRLRGEFAFVIWDEVRGSLFCARDPMGIQPFYYSLNAGQFRFAGDIPTLLDKLQVCDELDEGYSGGYLSGEYDPTRSFYRNIRRLPPAHSLTITAAKTVLQRYWRPETLGELHYQRPDNYHEHFKHLLGQAVRDCLQGASPVGTHVSGGLDSSAIAVLAARECRSQGMPIPQAFCWLPPPCGEQSEDGEYQAVQRLCRQEALDLHYCPAQTTDMLELLQYDATCRPVDLALHQELAVQRKAQESGVRVILSGWGGDEGISFNGRGYYPELMRRHLWRRLFREARGESPAPVRWILGNALFPLLHPSIQRLVQHLYHGRRGAKKSYLHPRFGHKQHREPPVRGVHEAQLQLLFTLGHLDARIESWAWSGAQYGLSYRYPLLDRRILEFSLRLPFDAFRQNGWNRWFMRQALAGVIPDEIRWNRDKSDPIRMNSFFQASTAAVESLGRHVARLPSPPSRADYLDWPLLLQTLQQEQSRAGHGKLLRALHFLDFPQMP